MKPLILLFLCIGITCSALGAPAPLPIPSLPLTSHPDSKSWPYLIQSDLSNTDAPGGVWSMHDGVLTANDDKNIWTKQEYGNSILDLEFRFEPGANSGVFLYNSDPNQWMPTSVEIQICDDADPKWQAKPANWHCGSFFGHQAPTKSAVKPAGEWNRMTVTCIGQRIVTLLNGDIVSDIDLAKWTSGTMNPDGSPIPKWLNGRPFAHLPTKGRIGFQGRHAGAGIFFKNIRILPLPMQ